MNPKRMPTQDDSIALVPQAKNDALSMQDPIAWLGVEPLSEEVATCLRQVLRELTEEGLRLLRDPRLHIEVSPCSFWPNVWAERLRPRGRIPYGAQLKPGARFLLLISEPRVRDCPRRETKKRLRLHLGRLLLYVHHPRTAYEWECADLEWKRWTR